MLWPFYEDFAGNQTMAFSWYSLNSGNAGSGIAVNYS
jgi:hypothetical protein